MLNDDDLISLYQTANVSLDEFVTWPCCNRRTIEELKNLLKNRGVEMSTYYAIRNEIISNCLYDGYGESMAWLFAICDYIEHGLDPEKPYVVPFDWCYSGSPFGADVEAYEYQTLNELKPDYETLIKIGRVLLRYVDKLKVAGRDY